MIKSQLKSLVNAEVLNGRLPLAYYDSQILKKRARTEKENKPPHILYKQSEIPDGNCEFLISKIYEIF